MVKQQQQILLLLLLVQLTRGCVGERNTITHIKGFDGALPFSLETGYIEVEDVELFYYFIPSERNPLEDPLILWISGGPGCSGLNALLFEIGPLKLDIAGSPTEPRLVYFEDSWTKVSNVIFVDAPVGTGFSYARHTQGLNVSITDTGRQLRIFLHKWVTVSHPELVANPLYIGGDSYSGITVPVTALEVANDHNGLNLLGYMVGNGKTDELYDNGGKVPFMHGMGLISDDIYQAALGGCAHALQAVTRVTADINPSHILEPTCEADDLYRVEVLPVECLWEKGCRLSELWANDIEVREMLGVREGSITGSWWLCNPPPDLRRDVTSTISYHRNLTQRGYRALVYNGDHDLGFTFVGTQAWIRTLGYRVVAPWRPWYSGNQVAGYTTEYAYNFTFATVKGAGHMAPETRPKECLDMIQKWTSPKGRL